MATKDIVPKHNPATGLFDLEKGGDGNPIADESQTHAVLTQLLERRGSPGVPGWIWDSLAGSGEPGTHGSLLYLVTEDTPEQRSSFKAYALDALQPLVNAARISDVTADVAPSSIVPGRIDGLVTWKVPSTTTVQSIVIPISFP